MLIEYSRRRCLASIAAAAAIGPGWNLSGAPGVETTLRGATLPVASLAARFVTDQRQRVVITAIAIDPSGQTLAVAGDDHRIRIIRTSDLVTLHTIHSHRDRIRTLSFDQDGQRLASAGNDGQLILYRCQSSFPIIRRLQGIPALTCVRFSPDGETIAAVGFDNEVFLLGAQAEFRPMFRCDCQDLRAVAFRDDNRVLAAAGRSGDLHLFDLPTGQLIADANLHRGRIHAIDFHHQSNLAVCVGEDGTATIYDTENRQLIRQITVTTGKLFSAAVLSSQRVAVAGSDNVIRIINTDEGTITQQLLGHDGTVATLAANGGLLFSGSFDATLRRWSIGTFEREQRIAETDPILER